MKSCTIFSSNADLKKVTDQLEHKFGADSFSFVGPKDAWTELQVTRRKLIFKATVSFFPVSRSNAASKFESMLYKLRHVFHAVPAENRHLQHQLLARIKACELAIEVVAPRGIRGLEDVVFELTKALDGIIFWDGNRMLDSNGKLILDFEGKSGMNELERWASDEQGSPEVELSEEGIVRKERSETYLRSKKIPVNTNLPVLEAATLTQLRPQAETALRAMALCFVALKGEGMDQATVRSIIEEYEVFPFLSPEETAFVADESPTPEDRMRYTWRYEAMWTLFWALGFLEDLPYPDKVCDASLAVSIVRSAGNQKGFQDAARMRSAAEIMDQADLIFRMHWACVDAGLREEPAPGGLEAGVVYERLYALNWLRTIHGKVWDDVRTDF